LLFEIKEKAIVSLLMLSAKQGNYLYHFLTSFVNCGPLSEIELLHSKPPLYH